MLFIQLFAIFLLFHALCSYQCYHVTMLELLKPISLRGTNTVVCGHICRSFLSTCCVWFRHLSVFASFFFFFVAHPGRNVRADYQKQSSSHRVMVTFDKSDSAAAKKKKKLIQKSAFQLVSVCLRPSKGLGEKCSPVLGLCTAPHPR